MYGNGKIIELEDGCLWENKLSGQCYLMTIATVKD